MRSIMKIGVGLVMLLGLLNLLDRLFGRAAGTSILLMPQSDFWVDAVNSPLTKAALVPVW